MMNVSDLRISHGVISYPATTSVTASWTPPTYSELEDIRTFTAHHADNVNMINKQHQLLTEALRKLPVMSLSFGTAQADTLPATGHHGTSTASPASSNSRLVTSITAAMPFSTTDMAPTIIHIPHLSTHTIDLSALPSTFSTIVSVPSHISGRDGTHVIVHHSNQDNDDDNGKVQFGHRLGEAHETGRSWFGIGVW